MDSRIKKVEFPCFQWDKKGEVAYVVIGKEVFFSGLTRPGKATSTINAAEAVVLAICGAEGINWQDYTFVDIQTHRGYGSKELGEFEADTLVLESAGKEIFVKNWLPVSLTKEVRQLFDELISK